MLRERSVLLGGLDMALGLLVHAASARLGLNFPASRSLNAYLR